MHDLKQWQGNIYVICIRSFVYKRKQRRSLLGECVKVEYLHNDSFLGKKMINSSLLTLSCIKVKRNSYVEFSLYRLSTCIGSISVFLETVRNEMNCNFTNILILVIVNFRDNHT